MLNGPWCMGSDCADSGVKCGSSNGEIQEDAVVASEELCSPREEVVCVARSETYRNT